MELLTNYLPRTEFKDYEDFKKNFSIVIPSSFDFAHDIVDEWAKIDPDKLALLYCDDKENKIRFTFADISELSKRAASYFLSLGIKSGDRVLTLLRRRWEYWVCAVALHRIGAVVVPASIQLTEKDILYRINSADVKMMLAIEDSYVFEQIKHLKEKCPSLNETILIGGGNVDGFRNFNKEFMSFNLFEGKADLTNEDEMLIYFTSGTSGMPKMAIHDRTYPLGHIVTAKYMQRVQNGGLHLTQADSGWAKFGWGNIYGQWICGSAVLAYDPERFSTENIMHAMQKYKPTSLCIPPTMYRFLMHEGLKREHVESIKWYSTAGEPLSGKVNGEFYNLTGHYIHEGFGQSEGTPITCSFEWFDVRPSSMGKPSPLYDIALIHPDGTHCKPDEEGEVVIYTKDKNQLGLLKCYGRDGLEFNPTDENGVYHTGDIAYEDEDGYFWYVSRTDDMIKCSGYRIGPFEIESVLNMHPAVKESAIVGYADEIRGQVVCAVIKLTDEYKGSDQLTKELQTFVKENTAPYKYPRIIKYVNELPKTTSGKIIRNAIRKII
ncbi:MAG: AMP-binding protein [Lachnospiraceae bacterium]|nr:AMP-binding protein [Lachnospiraceae bacterium]